ncbi:hypothetical protein, partial [Mycolicibacterium poriferae]|uniref:hypothetical protein n=1 Tax=Mycolicibacterium poriferae TaxID=39694 RepID=UPI0024BA9CA0
MPLPTADNSTEKALQSNVITDRCSAERHTGKHLVLRYECRFHPRTFSRQRSEICGVEFSGENKRAVTLLDIVCCAARS